MHAAIDRGIVALGFVVAFNCVSAVLDISLLARTLTVLVVAVVAILIALP